MKDAMQFVIRDARPETVDVLREYAARRLSFALRSVERCVRHVTVRFVDLNGPRRGVDSRCSITVDLVGGRRVFAVATTAWPFASASRAARRVSDAVRRETRRGIGRRRATARERRAGRWSPEE